MKNMNEMKFIAALNAAPEIEEEIIGIYSQAQLLDTMISERTYPNYYRLNAQVYACVHGRNLEGKLLAVAKQFIGVIAKAQRETGFMVFTRYFATDEDKVEALREMCDYFNNFCSFNDEYTCVG